MNTHERHGSALYYNRLLFEKRSTFLCRTQVDGWLQVVMTDTPTSPQAHRGIVGAMYGITWGHLVTMWHYEINIERKIVFVYFWLNHKEKPPPEAEAMVNFISLINFINFENFTKISPIFPP